MTAAEIVDQIPPGGPYPNGTVAFVTAVDRTLGAPIVSCDGELTYSGTKTLIDVEEYRRQDSLLSDGLANEGVRCTRRR